ncbi:MAG: hypothetical protein JXB34_15420, partial [Bacteroidales bacterium]|nr:hypothetical protein [Bacteroidales bacterium]
SGYAAIGRVIVDTEKHQVRLDLRESGKSVGGYTKIPKTACKEFYRYNRLGVLDNNSSIPKMDETFEKALVGFASLTQTNSFGLTELSTIKDIGIAVAKTVAQSPFLFSSISNINIEETCKYIEPCLSYIKIPVVFAKRGGGVRVKRLLLYDKGIEDGTAVVYGNNYRYVLDDGITSSGVASNEPNTIRDENPLISYIPKKDQRFWSRITTGIDKEQTEGPAGESLLPVPDIIYSRVVVENIHTGETGTGFSVSEYYTTKDYPFDKFFTQKENSDFYGKAYDNTEIKEETDKLYLPAGIINFKVNKLWMVQSFRFILNSMNGVQKRVSGYGGNYAVPSATNQYKRDTDGAYLITKQEYEYFEPGEKVPVWSWSTATNSIEEELIVPGKEMDLSAEKKESKDFTVDFKLSIDPGVGVLFLPPVFVTANFALGFNTKMVSTHSATKVIRYPVIIKKIKNYTDGMFAETEYLAFDKGTGKPMVTRTSDSNYRITAGTLNSPENAYFSLEVPAYWFYPGMGKKSIQTSNNNMLSAILLKVSTFGNKSTDNTEGAMPGVNSIASNYSQLSLNFKNVISLSVQTYKNNWNNSWNNSKVSSDYGANVHAALLNRLWRPWCSYTYHSDIENTNTGVFNVAATIQLDNDNADNNKWIKVSEITKYTPNGNPVEEVNALGIYSSVLYDKAYNNTVPSMVAGNAQYEAIYFNSFEGKDGIVDNRFRSHSGNKCFQYYSSQNLINGVYLTQNLQKSGARVFVWAREGNMEGLSATLLPNIVLDITEKAKVDGWILYHIDITPEKLTGLMLNSQLAISLYRNYGYFMIDDVRFQPLDSQASCFVYDESLRLVAQFDDQHFGTYYQYNSEGKLVRKIVETERGRKTIQETQYLTPKKSQ